MSAALTCYTIGWNFVSSSNQYFGCGVNNTAVSASDNHQACCYAGDTCLADGICHYDHQVQNGTGYYMAGCTDPTWQDPACPKPCTSEYGADVTWEPSSNSWRCCNSSKGFLDCESPSNTTVQAPAPSDLSTIRRLTTAVPSPALVTGIGKVSSIGSGSYSLSVVGPLTTSVSQPTNSSTVTGGNGTSATLNSTLVATLSQPNVTSTFLSTRTASLFGSSESSETTSTEVIQPSSTSQPSTSAEAPSATAAATSSSSAAGAEPTMKPQHLALALGILLPAALGLAR